MASVECPSGGEEFSTNASRSRATGWVYVGGVPFNCQRGFVEETH
jgi:hypothetical protein